MFRMFSGYNIPQGCHNVKTTQWDLYSIMTLENIHYKKIALNFKIAWIQNWKIDSKYVIYS